MGDMDQAAQRLEQAVARLEAASKRAADVKMTAAPSDNAALVDATTLVAARLEQAISRIDRLLED
jgi:hypothetical protein